MQSFFHMCYVIFGAYLLLLLPLLQHIEYSDFSSKRKLEAGGQTEYKTYNLIKLSSRLRQKWPVNMVVLPVHYSNFIHSLLLHYY